MTGCCLRLSSTCVLTIALGLLSGTRAGEANAASQKVTLVDHVAIVLTIQDGIWTFKVGEPVQGGFYQLVSGAEPKKRVGPTFPPDTMKLGNYRCSSWIYTEEDGTPAEVDLTECDETHRGPIREALAKWRFDAPEVDGKFVHSFYRADVLLKVDGSVSPERSVPVTTQGQAIVPAALIPAGRCAWNVPAPVPDLGIPPVRTDPQGAVFALDCASTPPNAASRVVPADLKVRSFVEPVSPDAGGAAAACSVRVYTDQHGVPLNVGVVDCPTERQAGVLKAVKEWRFTPVLVDGKPSPVNFLFSLSLPAAAPKAPAPAKL
jgi:hypothetical protein